MIRFREHRGSLADSMETLRNFENLDALFKWLIQEMDSYGLKVTEGDIKVEPYGYDERIGWDTYLVTIKGWGVIGMSDGL